MASKKEASDHYVTATGFEALMSDDEDGTEPTQMNLKPAAKGFAAADFFGSGSPLVDGRVDSDKSADWMSASHHRKPKKETAMPQSPRKAAVQPPRQHAHRPTMSASNTIELYDFPAALKTHDLHQALAAFEGKFRIKWNHDTSCYAIFNEPSDAAKALAETSAENVRLRPYAPPTTGAGKPEAAAGTAAVAAPDSVAAPADKSTPGNPRHHKMSPASIPSVPAPANPWKKL